jgi:putative DNA primase/helicase
MNALRSMAAALGGDVMKGRDGPYILCPGPGHSAADRSLSVTPSSTAPDGFIVNSFANNDWRVCRDHVAGRLGRPRDRHQAPARAMPRSDPSAGHLALWKEAKDPRNTIVQTYLSGRGLALPDDIAGRVVRFHPACPFGPGVRHPCMITAFRSIADDSLQAIHRTALTPDGKKIDRKMLGPVAGAAIKIDADEDIEQGLMIGEGFETCMGARQLGLRPVWALGSAGAIAAFPVLSGIDAITLLAETDDSGANAKAVRACGNRWAGANREVIVATPYIRGDMNDAVQA